MGYVQGPDPRLPYFEYEPDEKNRWIQPTRFFGEIDDQGVLVFATNVPGLIEPGEELDNHVTERVVMSWEHRCHVSALIYEA
jgi:hypothetical protein